MYSSRAISNRETASDHKRIAADIDRAGNGEPTVSITQMLATTLISVDFVCLLFLVLHKVPTGISHSFIPEKMYKYAELTARKPFVIRTYSARYSARLGR